MSDTVCRVYLDLSRTLPQEDTTGSFIVSGMVMYLETMKLAAETVQYRLAYTLLSEQQADQNGLQPFAEVTITQDQMVVPTYPREIFFQRHTSRHGQLAKKIPDDAQRTLQKLAETFGQQYRYESNPQVIAKVISQNIFALFHDLNQSSYHDEITHWFRFTKRGSYSAADGLDARCMHISRPEYFLSAKCPWLFRIPLLRNLFFKRYKAILGSTYCIGWLSGGFWTREDAINSGKLLTRFWLELTRAGLYIHPFGNLVTNVPARSWFERELDTSDVWFVFRIGYTTPPPRSYRKKVKEILL